LSSCFPEGYGPVRPRAPETPWLKAACLHYKVRQADILEERAGGIERSEALDLSADCLQGLGYPCAGLHFDDEASRHPGYDDGAEDLHVDKVPQCCLRD